MNRAGNYDNRWTVRSRQLIESAIIILDGQTKIFILPQAEISLC